MEDQHGGEDDLHEEQMLEFMAALGWWIAVVVACGILSARGSSIGGVELGGGRSWLLAWWHRRSGALGGRSWLPRLAPGRVTSLA